jgi:hypothetical protein
MGDRTAGVATCPRDVGWLAANRLGRAGRPKCAAKLSAGRGTESALAKYEASL